MLDIVEEPTGDVYSRLIDFAASVSSEFLVVEREHETGGRGDRFLDVVIEHHIRTAARGAWPGTELIGHTATVFVFRSTTKAAGVIKRLASGLYDWGNCQSVPEETCHDDRLTYFRRFFLRHVLPGF